MQNRRSPRAQQESLDRWLTKRSERQEKANTGTGRLSKSKRLRCSLSPNGKPCQAFASPSGSGYCSHHEQMITPVGELVSDAKKFKCHSPDCVNPQSKDCEYCVTCTKARMERAMDLDAWDDTLGD